MANDEEYEAVDGTTWSYRVKDGEATIIKCLRCKPQSILDISEPSTDNIAVPSRLGGYPVTSIGCWAFSHCSGLKSLTIPDSVTSIESSAFSGCSGLTSLTIPDSVTSIGDAAFYQCSGLTSLTIPDSVTSIGDGAFRDCHGLTSLTIPDSVTSIGWMAFSGCSGLTNVKMRYTRKRFAFIKYIVHPSINARHADRHRSSMTSIEPMVFAPRPRHVLFVVDSCNPKYKSVNGLVLTKDGKTLVLGINGNVTIPEGVESIGKEAFRLCEGLVSVTIPDSVTSIDDTAFANCDNLTSIFVSDGNSVYSSANGLLLSKDGKTLLKGVNGDVAIPHGVTTICGMAFCNRKGLRRVTIPDSVTNIEDGAFFGCSQLTRVEIPAGAANMSIGANSFDGCDLLAEMPRVGGAFPGAPGDPVRKEWERKVDAIYGECRSLLMSRGREGVKTIVKRAFSIIPDEWRISNKRDAGRYFRLFCNRIGCNCSMDNDPLKDAQVEFGFGAAYLFEFTCGKSSYHALAARESHGVGEFWNWTRAHLFGVNYNPGTRSIDEPYSTSYEQRRIPRTCRNPGYPGDCERALCRVDLDEYGKDDDIEPMRQAIERFESREGRSLERGKPENKRKKLEEEVQERETVEVPSGEKFVAILTILLGILSWIYLLVESIGSGKVFDAVVMTIISLMIAFLVYVLRRRCG